LLR
ncbi:unnamed protein product, partial [Callosobruchus maculatus]|jgi:hypothetical protein